LRERPRAPPIPGQGPASARGRRRADRRRAGTPAGRGADLAEGLPGALRRPGRRRGASSGGRAHREAALLAPTARDDSRPAAQAPRRHVTVLDASVAIKWFVADEPGAEAAWDVLRTIEADPRSFV